MTERRVPMDIGGGCTVMRTVSEPGFTRGTRVADDRREVPGDTLAEAVQRAALEKAMIALDEQIHGMRLEFDIEKGDEKWDVSVGWEPAEGLVIITKKHERLDI